MEHWPRVGLSGFQYLRMRGAQVSARHTCVSASYKSSGVSMPGYSRFSTGTVACCHPKKR